MQRELRESGENQISEVDTDARMLRIKWQDGVRLQRSNCLRRQVQADFGGGCGTERGNDSQQLESMMTKSQEATSSKGKNGRFGSNDFRYDAQDDTVVCPAGQRLIREGPISSKGKRYFSYGSTAAVCGNCPLSDGCLTKKKSIRKVYRWEHEDVMERHRKKMSTGARLMRKRGGLVEHQFGTLKRWAGMDHFLMRGKGKCRGEFSLMTLSYNFKRVMNVVGVEAFTEFCLQRQRVGKIGV